MLVIAGLILIGFVITAFVLKKWRKTSKLSLPESEFNNKQYKESIEKETLELELREDHEEMFSESEEAFDEWFSESDKEEVSDLVVNEGLEKETSEPELGKADEELYLEQLSHEFNANLSTEHVEFGVFSPECIASNSTFCLDVWAYLSSEYSYVLQLTKSLDRTNLLARKLGVFVERNALLTIRIEIPELFIQDPFDTVAWNGVPTNASFIVKVPTDIKTGSYPGKVVIAFQGISIAKITFLINISTEPYLNYTDCSETIVYPKSAFASYARENRHEVLSRIQGMKKIAPNLNIFIDVFSLRSGQNWLEKLEEHVPNKDVFYLFWSQSASSSEWVEREWKLALHKRGISYIDPVPLDEPDLVSPPQELASLHFFDAYVSYINYERIKKQMHDQK